jgi:NTP pyrophosphatase (non-canonical NTP hydrolase)
VSGTTRLELVLQAVRDERTRQELKRLAGDWTWTCSDPAHTAAEKLPVLIEEVGEVAKAMLEGSNTREELVHVAAVAVAWAESL